MKFKLTKEEFEKLSEDFQKEYTEKDGEYVLTIEGGEDTGALKRAKDHEKQRRQQAEQKARDLEAQLGEIQEQLEDLQNNSGKSGDIQKLEAQWKKKLKDREDELTQQLNSLNSEVNKLLVDNVADQLAMKLSDAPAVLKPHIKSRLTVEYVDGKPVTRVKDLDGEISIMTLDELESEFKSNKDFAPIIRGSQGSGSGAGGGNGGTGGTKPEKPNFSTASPKEIAEYIKSTKE